MGLALFGQLPPVGIRGLGHALPGAIRDNRSELYDETPQDHPFRALFTGYETRRALGNDESLAALMARACEAALTQAGSTKDSIDLLTGYASVGEFVAPNELFNVHRLLDLPVTADSLPVADEFTAFLS